MNVASEQTEEWLPVPGWANLYEASTHGRIRRNGIPDRRGWTTYCWRVIATRPAKTGYLRGHMWDGVQQKNISVHQIVALTFLGPCPLGQTVNHKDGDKANPRPDNLEYMTRSQNARHALDVLGFQPPRGSDHWRTELNEEKVRDVRRLRGEGLQYKAIAQAIGTTWQVVGQIIRGESWSHVT